MSAASKVSPVEARLDAEIARLRAERTELVDALADLLGTNSDDPAMDAKYDRAEVLVERARAEQGVS